MSVHLPALAWRLGLFGVIWLTLCGGEFGSWPFGLPAVILATWFDLQLAGGDQPRALRPLVLLRFLPFFFGKSILGGLDVMARVLNPRLAIDPGLVEFPLTIPHGRGRIFLANCITLLPGTLSARLADDHIIVHTLDKGLPVLATIQDLERRIASLYEPCPGKDTGRGLP